MFIFDKNAIITGSMKRIKQWIASFTLLLLLGISVHSALHNLESHHHEHACSVCQLQQDDTPSLIHLKSASLAFSLTICRIEKPTTRTLSHHSQAPKSARGPPLYS